MKVAILLSFLAIVSATYAGTVPHHHRGCIYILGNCHHECPEGTHSFSTACGYVMPEATCTNPNPVLDKRGKICDYSACYCDPPTLRDEKSRRCVLPEECPKEEVEHE